MAKFRFTGYLYCMMKCCSQWKPGGTMSSVVPDVIARKSASLPDHASRLQPPSLQVVSMLSCDSSSVCLIFFVCLFFACGWRLFSCCFFRVITDE